MTITHVSGQLDITSRTQAITSAVFHSQIVFGLKMEKEEIASGKLLDFINLLYETCLQYQATQQCYYTAPYSSHCLALRWSPNHTERQSIITS